MGVGLAAIGFAALGDLLEASDAFGAAGVDADDVDRSGREYPFELLQRPFALAIGDARRGLGAQVGIAFRVPCAERLLHPGQIVFLHRPATAHRVVTSHLMAIPLSIISILSPSTSRIALT